MWAKPTGIDVPQIWMTYSEISELLDCSIEEARSRVVIEQLDRKISRDGQRRVKLNELMMITFVRRIQEAFFDNSHAVRELRRMHDMLRSESDLARNIAPQSRQSVG
ncbi:hypothetical protein [Bradyrhizobium sp. BR13661]|jgi:hypothetical protein|uniref:hypothetical protein n=1 Tax=Bradyrhizobium sp. BR13661 TaxID=2940622 RepID=UPI002477179C|nr:hypothetical protein [Bradyrhizobium sp. BR13661]MDH6263364.1 hypothetical protein [Bradyrhizobium sp. BR13661]